MTFAPTPPPPAPPVPPAEKRTRRFSRTQRALMAGGLAAGLALGGAAFLRGPAPVALRRRAPVRRQPPLPRASRRPRGRPHAGPGRSRRPSARACLASEPPAHSCTARPPSILRKAVQTFAYQIGKASGVTSSSITVTPSNRHMQQYTVTPSTIVPAQVGGHHGGGFGRPGDCYRHGVRLHLHGRQRRRHLAGAAGPVGLGLRPGREAWGKPAGNPPTTPRAAAFAGGSRGRTPGVGAVRGPVPHNSQRRQRWRRSSVLAWSSSACTWARWASLSSPCSWPSRCSMRCRSQRRPSITPATHPG